MALSNQFDKRKLLLEVFSGNLNNVRAYKALAKSIQEKRELNSSQRFWIVDARGIGGGITENTNGVEREIPQAEFDALPHRMRVRVWTIRNHRGNLPPIAPDEEYTYNKGEFTFPDGRRYSA